MDKSLGLYGVDENSLDFIDDDKEYDHSSISNVISDVNIISIVQSK